MYGPHAMKWTGAEMGHSHTLGRPWRNVWSFSKPGEHWENQDSRRLDPRVYIRESAGQEVLESEVVRCPVGRFACAQLAWMAEVNLVLGAKGRCQNDAMLK